MYCYNHSDRVAAGRCRACGRGFCSECASEATPDDQCLSCATGGKTATPDVRPAPGRWRSVEDLPLKLVAHFKDGRVLKGTTTHLNVSSEGFTMQVLRGEMKDDRIFVPFSKLKSVYHVRDFEGSPDADRPNGKRMDSSALGDRIVIRYRDGEHLEGFLAGKFRPANRRFSVVPAHEAGNNISILVERSAVEDIQIGPAS